MAIRGFSDVAVVGVGLLGGSLALAAKAVDPFVRVVGVGHRQASLDTALQAGAADEVTLDASEGVASADLVVLCTPIGKFAPLLRQIAGALKRGAVVTDVGSTKARVVRLAERILAGRAAFVGSHPIAGGEQRGVVFARADLYANRTCVVTPTPRTPKGPLRRVSAFWRDLGMTVVSMSPVRHDRVLARVSHLPHAIAASLVNTQSPDDLDQAGPGFSDATRIAGGDPPMWRDIFLTNRPATLRAIDAFERQLRRFRQLLSDEDARGLERLLARAQKRRADMLERRLRQGRVEG